MSIKSNYFSDDPILDSGDDLLGRGSFVEQVVDALDLSATQGSSRVCALIGPWGAGKSSVLALLEQQLIDSAKKWKIAHFNPWIYSDEASMQLGFFSELRDCLPAEDKTFAARNAVARFSTSIVPFGAIAGAFLGVDGATALKGVSDLLDGTPSASKAFAAAKKALSKSETPILMILDDLDRLSPDELILTAKLVRLVGRLPNVFYLLAYDEKTLLDTLSRTDLVGDETRAQDYLEKIVQIRFDLPPLRHEHADALVDGKFIDLATRLQLELSTTDKYRFGRNYETTLAPRLRTPRSISRFFAQLESLSPKLASEINPVDYILLTWLRVAEPRLYEMLFEKKSWALGHGRDMSRIVSQTDREAAVRNRFETLTRNFAEVGIHEPTSNPVVALAVDLFPVLRSDLMRRSSRSEVDERWAETRRVAHPDYFDRYFAYEVPPNDVSDQIIEEGIRAMSRYPHSASSDVFEQAFLSNTTLVCRKLRRRLPEPLAASRWILERLSYLSPDGGLTSTPRTTAEGLVEDLILRIEPGKVKNSLVELTGAPNGNDLLIRLGTRLSEDRETTAMYAKVPLAEVEAVWDSLKDLLPALLEDALKSNAESPFQLPAGSVDWLLLLEAAQPGRGREWLAQKQSAGWPLLDVIARTIPTVATNVSDEVKLGELSYFAFGRLFDPDIVQDTLKEELNAELPSRHRSSRLSDTPENRRVVALEGLKDYFRDNPREY